MRCPVCKQNLRTIPPCKGEWICVNEDCPIYRREVYGITQREITQFVKDIHPEHMKAKKKELLK